MENKLVSLYQGHPTVFSWHQLQNLPHTIFDEDNATLIIEAHKNGEGLELHLSQEEAEKMHNEMIDALDSDGEEEMTGGKLTLKKVAHKLSKVGKKINNIPKELGEDRSLTRIAQDIDKKHHITKKIHDYDKKHHITKQVGDMVTNGDMKGLNRLAKQEYGKAKDEYGNIKSQVQHHVKNLDLDTMLDTADKYIQQYEQHQQQDQPMEGGKIKWKKVGKKLGHAGMQAVNFQNKIAHKVANNLPLDHMGEVGDVVKAGLALQDRGVALANNLYDRRKDPGGLKNHLKGAATDMAKAEIRNAVNHGIDAAIGSVAGGSFRGNGMLGGSFRPNGGSYRGGSFRGNGVRSKPRNSKSKLVSNRAVKPSDLPDSRFTEPEKIARTHYWNPEEHYQDRNVLHPEQPGFYAFRVSNTQPNYYRKN